MSILPDKLVALWARTDADFEQEFTFYEDQAQATPMDLTGWTFRFVAKKSALDAGDWLVAEGANVMIAANAVTVLVERDTLAAALAASEARIEGEWALQATGPDDRDAVWAAGAFALVRGL